MKRSLCLLMLAALTAVADVIPSAIFTSDMVLQRDMPHPVWGKAEPGELVVT